MSRIELNIRFPDKDQVIVKFRQEESQALAFKSPITKNKKALEDLRWYIEVYAAEYTGEPDDEEAKRIEANLIVLGEALFQSIFTTDAALTLFHKFQQQHADRLLTIQTDVPEILALPWELLRQPQSTFLFDQQPRISIRRHCVKSHSPIFTLQAKPKLRLLFIVSRPNDASFLDPRLDPQAVLDALTENDIAQIEVEFLRPATLRKLVERLENKDLPPVDIIHFDGHGVYDETEQLGYLLFETRGAGHFVTSAQLAELLVPHHIALVVLSACQSATIGHEPLGSVAAGLTDKGVPTVLAMVYSVLVQTTRQLFAAFYQHIATGQGIGAALDYARQALANKNQRGTRRRGEGEFELTLQDWFVPALYSTGQNDVLLQSNAPKIAKAELCHDLPALQAAGFFGRSWELWQIERGFVQGVERITITGFGGQGKTYLAIEATRWLLQTDLFDAVCFVDFSRYQGLDALRYALNALGVLLDTTLLDENAVPPLLQTRRLLWVWDNLESLAAETLDELLTVAARWSAQCRFLFTTRQHRFTHADYAEGNSKHGYVDLSGLAEPDALAYFNRLWQSLPLPERPYPARYELMALFGKVAFHPLSIGLLAQQLKSRTIEELGERLEALLQGENNTLLASLRLSLESLPPEQRELVKRLGVFQGGAMEDVLLRVTGLGKVDDTPDIALTRELFAAFTTNDIATIAEALDIELPDGLVLSPDDIKQIKQIANAETGQLAKKLATTPSCELAEGVNEQTWQQLKQNLESIGLIQLEDMNHFGITTPYLKFHPTLAPTLWQKLSSEQQHQLSTRVTQCYYGILRLLYAEDKKNPHAVRVIVKRELPNLLHTIYLALQAQTDFAIEFSVCLNFFLNIFGLQREQAALNIAAQQTSEEFGSESWILARSNQGQQLFTIGQYARAQIIFTDLLTHMGEVQSYQRCIILSRLGRCLRFQGKITDAISCYKLGLTAAEQLPSTVQVQRHISTIHNDLADAFISNGDYTQAKNHLEQFLTTNDTCSVTVASAHGQLGSLAMRQRDFVDAEQHYLTASHLFSALDEPESEANILNNLGEVYRSLHAWDQAELAHRNAAKIRESCGNLTAAAASWNNLGLVAQDQGKLKVAERWFCKAIKQHIQGDTIELAISLINLAGLLAEQPVRLNEAQQIGEEALAIMVPLDEASTEVWKTFNLLASIAEQQSHLGGCKHYRQLSRDSFLRFAGMPYQMKQYAPFINFVLESLKKPKPLTELQILLQQIPKYWQNLTYAIKQILNGERNETFLLEPLNYEEAAIIHLILKGIENPESLDTLFNS